MNWVTRKKINFSFPPARPYSAPAVKPSSVSYNSNTTYGRLRRRSTVIPRLGGACYSKPTAAARDNGRGGIAPSCRLATWNTRGLSAYPTNAAAKRRRGKIVCNIKALISRNDVLCLQETKLNSKEGDDGTSVLERMVPGTVAYHSNLESGARGVVILIRAEYHDLYWVSWVELQPGLKGSVMGLRFAPKDDLSPPFVVVNCHLDSTTNFARKRKQIADLLLLPAPRYSFFAGDWNFTEHARDAPSGNTERPPKSFLTVWGKFLEHFGLKEISQPLHTFYKVCAEKELSSTSRLDRIYVSHSESDIALDPPTASFVPVPYSVLRSKGFDKEGNYDVGRHWDNYVAPVSDHLPVSISYAKSGPPSSKKIPLWMAEDKRYIHIFTSFLEDLLDTELPCFEQHEAFVEIAFEAKKAFYREKVRCENDQASRLTLFSAAIKAIKLLTREKVDSNEVNTFFSQYPSLRELVTRREGGTDISRLRSKADELATEVATSVDGDSVLTQGPSNFLSDIKKTLPSQRTRLPGLRETIDGPLVTDPEEMAALAKGFWGGIWAPRDSSGCHARGYLEDYSKRINPFLTPRRLDKNHFIPIINATNNSCAGPDGVPFAVYRAGVGVYAGIAASIFNWLADGKEAPEGFNYGILFLLPKKGIGVPSDTRPLSVTNACNRIIAKGVLSCLAPAMVPFLHESQKGFVPGRKGADHIRALNELFYGALEGMGDDSYVLFVDTQKAFDSIDHDFLFKVLARVGVPAWLVRIIKALLTDVMVTPVFGGSTSVWISILRGVKQGCPLSPLLFAIAYDPLLVRLGRIKGLSTFGFADDLAISAARFRLIEMAMGELDAFALASGLGINVSKTTVIAARCGMVALGDLVASSPWPDLTVAMSYVYLGILMGREVTVAEIYAEALDHLTNRAAAVLPAVRKLHHAGRVTAFNVFIFTKLTYIMNFYTIPYGSEKDSLNNVVSKCSAALIINFKNAYSHTHLYQPFDRFGPSPAVRDAWIVNCSLLTAQADLGAWEGVTEGVRERGVEDFMKISDHVRASAQEFVDWHLQGLKLEGEVAVFKPEGFIGTTEGATRKLVYKRLQLVAYRGEQDASTKVALSRRGLPASQGVVNFLHEHYAKASKGLSPRFRRTTFKLVFNALATSTRSLVLFYKKKVIRDAQPRSPCFLCGDPFDDIEHIYGGGCGVVVQARSIFSKEVGIDLAPPSLLRGHALSFSSAGPSISLLSNCSNPISLPIDTSLTHHINNINKSRPHNNPYTNHHTAISAYLFKLTSFLVFAPISQRITDALLVFNAVVWTQRGTFFKTRGEQEKLEPSAAAIRIAGAARHALAMELGVRGGRFGNATDRTPEQAAAACRYARKLLANVPVGHAVAYTDGSAIGNPGPAGAGCYLFVKGEEEGAIESFAALGEGTNNLGELWGVAMALQMTRRLPPSGFPYALHIFTDSMFTIDVIQGAATSREHATLIYHIRTLIDILVRDRIISSLELSWVPGHAGLEGNETADVLANLGSKGSQMGSNVLDTTARMKLFSFVPD